MLSDIYSIIVTFNPNLALLSDAIDAHISGKTKGIIVVDNNSQNKSAINDLLINKKSNMLTSVFLDSNQGIGLAQNKGIEIARQFNAEYVILFDQDSVVYENMIEDLIVEEKKLIAEGVKLGAIGPSYFDARSGNYYPQAQIKGTSLQKVWPDSYVETNINVSFIIASGCLIRISTLNDVGVMNERLFIDGIDVEWCLRASSKGYKIYFSKNVKLPHTIGDKRIKSLGREISMHAPVRKYYMMRNNLLMSRFEWIPVGYRIRLLFMTLLKTPIYLYDVNFNIKYMKYIFSGIFDGLLNKDGIYQSRNDNTIS